MKIKRTKTGQGGPDGLPPSVATHWAVCVQEDGRVGRWTAEESLAEDYGQATAARVRAYYAGRGNVGVLEFVGEETPEPEPPLAPGMAEALAEIESLRTEVARLRDVCDRQESQAAGLRRELEEARAAARKPAPPPRAPRAKGVQQPQQNHQQQPTAAGAGAPAEPKSEES